MTTRRDPRHSTGRRTALVLLTAAVWLVASAPLAAAAPPDHARAPVEDDAEQPVAPDGGAPQPAPEDGDEPHERGKRDEAPGQATRPGRSADAPGRATPPEPTPPVEPTPDPAPEPGDGRTPDRRPEPAPDRAPEPAPVAPTPRPPSGTASPGRTAPPPPATSAGDDASAATTRPVRTVAPTEEAGSATPTGELWSAFDLLRSTLRAAGDTAGAVGADVAGSVGSATSEAARHLTSSLGHAEPYAPRDLGVPMGVLLLFGAYLAGSRWLDRGALPMAISEGQGDDVQHVL